MIAAIITDCDGTITDSLSIWTHLASDDLRSRGVQQSPQLNKHLARCTVLEGAEYIRTTYNLDCTTNELLTTWQKRLARFYAEEATAKPGACAFLEACATYNIPVICASLSPEMLIRPLLVRTHLAPLMVDILCGHELKLGKEDPAFFELALTQLGTPRANTWVMEDSLYALETAQKAGFPTIAIYDPNHSSAHWMALQETADYSFETLVDAEQWLHAQMAQ